MLRIEGGRAIQRLARSLDILYIGRATKSTIRTRLATHYRNHLFKRLRKELGAIEVSWRCPKTDYEIRTLDSDLLARYQEQHIELPPLNRAQPGIALQQVKKILKLLPQGAAMMEVASANGYPLEIPDEI